MAASLRGRRRLGFAAMALVLLFAAARAYAASLPSDDKGEGASGTATPQDRPPAAAPAQPEAMPATPPDAGKPTPPDAGKKAEPPPPNLETLDPREAIGLLGKKVRDAAGDDMGMVVDVLVDSEGRPRAAVIDFGGFLGVGSRKIAVDWRLLQLKPIDSAMSVLLSLTRAEVQAAPEYKPSSNPGQPVMVVGPPPPSTAAPAPSDAPR